MGTATWILLGIFVLVLLLIVIPLGFLFYLYLVDEKQDQHAVLRNFPVLGKVRYFLEMLGPEMRQYWFDHDNSGKPFSREDYKHIVLPAKYKKSMVGFGSKRDFDKPGYYIRNSMFPVQKEDLRSDNGQMVDSKYYEIKDENLFSRKEQHLDGKVKPWLLADEDAVVIGENCKYPFTAKGLIGMSAMSYGALGERAITALSKGLGMATGAWMNTGEGGLSDHHLSGDVDIIMQIGPGLFGVRTKDGQMDWDELKRKSELKQVKAIELKLAQGAKARGGHLDGSKVSPEIAIIRGVEEYKTVDSPNRFNQFHDVPTMVDFIDKIRDHTGLPVGIKMVVGSTEDVDALAKFMKETGRGPNFITIDGGEGGSGATYQALADGVGLPIRPAIMIMNQKLKEYGVRDQVKIIASGKLFTPDKVAVLLGMGADLVNIARAFMISVGCIMAQRCHTNTCPVGVATTDEKLQKALVINEKAYRVVNFVVTLREGLFNMAAAAGVKSPALLEEKHIAYKDDKARTYGMDDLYKEHMKQTS
ncbi:glutamate synthase (ferredoxin) [Scopulibacillus darangshiensis]|uniref:Glutamate synthase (Ferredoxin) n=1 Tax=Scopulibacillus darangshiensis TaxID=442528 RepID=A0A4R2NRH7_9BACL|nr:FMN-binding glutamate synthase family protein [Scopulibacillus darangshiensis]TCP24523.1 glutamate synthase (ferredoxin) [Scopulibacillus darangshiensis]